MTMYLRKPREAAVSIVLAIQMTIMFVVAPLATTGTLPLASIDALRIGLAAVSALLLTKGIRSLVVIMIILGGSIYLVAGFRGVGPVNLNLGRILAATAFDAVVASLVAQAIFRPGRVGAHRIMGALVLYLSIGLIFANVYRAAALTLHQAFSISVPKRSGAMGELLYFSLGTLTTSGTGNVWPVHPFVKSLANLEAVVGQVFLATLLARLVTLHTGNKEGDEKS